MGLPAIALATAGLWLRILGVFSVVSDRQAIASAPVLRSSPATEHGKASGKLDQSPVLRLLATHPRCVEAAVP